VMSRSRRRALRAGHSHALHRAFRSLGNGISTATTESDLAAVAQRGRPTRPACQIAQQVTTAVDPVWVANINSATQTVFSGTTSALQKVADAARIAGAFNYERINVSVASHCPKQAVTAQRLAAHLAGLPRREPTARYLTNTRGRATTSAETVLDDLAQAVAHTVQWYDATRLMGELGATGAIETQPGHVLTRLLPSAAPTVAAISLQDSGLAAAARRANRLLDTEDRSQASTS
jgi:malonyl CoA-acyl carrier protein transacylase